MTHNNTRRLTRDALLTAVALTIFVVEAQFPTLIPIPGVKPGLSNIVTVWAMFTLGPADALAILCARILLSVLFTGHLMTWFYSIGGGTVSYLLLWILRRLVTHRQIWIASALSGTAHNAGQLAVAILLLRTPALIVYLPFLTLSGLVAGTFTGLCAQFLIARHVRWPD